MSRTMARVGDRFDVLREMENTLTQLRQAQLRHDLKAQVEGWHRLAGLSLGVALAWAKALARVGRCQESPK